jgi:hypothetical protein
MCGRYVSPNEASVEREFTLVRTEWQPSPPYNVDSIKDGPVVRLNKAGERTGARLHWGLIPFWAKGEDRDAWLTGTPDEASAVIKQYPDTHMVATPVSKRVNTPKNNDAELVAPFQRIHYKCLVHPLGIWRVRKQRITRDLWIGENGLLEVKECSGTKRFTCAPTAALPMPKLAGNRS